MEVSDEALVFNSQRCNFWICRRTTAKAFAKDVFIDQDQIPGSARKRVSANQYEAVWVSTSQYESVRGSTTSQYESVRGSTKGTTRNGACGLI